MLKSTVNRLDRQKNSKTLDEQSRPPFRVLDLVEPAAGAIPEACPECAGTGECGDAICFLCDGSGWSSGGVRDP
ncbi:MAG: hypothetical protein A2252_01495 [Elusimicrobia bacterium RIFOXYA2_FULL_39_19]|nr:MAG: hypothetical protein A2252_01495 [Elusimicrobia bacterium RIFOXYA2_FULL_39_19]